MYREKEREIKYCIRMQTNPVKTLEVPLSTLHQRKHITIAQRRRGSCIPCQEKSKRGRRVKSAYSWTAVFPWQQSLHQIIRRKMLGSLTLT